MYILVMYLYFILQYILYIIIMLIAGNAADLQCAFLHPGPTGLRSGNLSATQLTMHS